MPCPLAPLCRAAERAFQCGARAGQGEMNALFSDPGACPCRGQGSQNELCLTVHSFRLCWGACVRLILLIRGKYWVCFSPFCILPRN